ISHLLQLLEKLILSLLLAGRESASHALHPCAHLDCRLCVSKKRTLKALEDLHFKLEHIELPLIFEQLGLFPKLRVIPADLLSLKAQLDPSMWWSIRRT